MLNGILSTFSSIFRTLSGVLGVFNRLSICILYPLFVYRIFISNRIFQIRNAVIQCIIVV
ncbi:hypothetical protein DKP61_14495 [Salmonella enterica subsp. enterica serovar Johannesburg]|nr:hypothetical protein [Salmonella enterica subsp. enterica serovar Johannesburg]